MFELIYWFFNLSAGLLLLMGCGIHIVWGIFRVFNWYRCDNDSGFYLRLVIWSWYIGAVIGSYAAGFIVTKLRKRQIYVRVFLNIRYFLPFFVQEIKLSIFILR